MSVYRKLFAYLILEFVYKGSFELYVRHIYIDHVSWKYIYGLFLIDSEQIIGINIILFVII